MICNKKILIIVMLLGFSVFAIAQGDTPPPPPSSGHMTKAEKEAREKAAKAEKERAEAEAKKRDEIRKLLEKQKAAKSESSSQKISETAATAVLAKAEAFHTAAMSQINTKHADWIKQYAKQVSEKKLDELTVKVMVKYYANKEGLNEAAMEGLTVLLLREAYVAENKEYKTHKTEAASLKNKLTELVTAKVMLADSSRQFTEEQLDSVNRLIMQYNDPAPVAEKNEEVRAPLPVQKMPQKKADHQPAANLSLTRMKLADSINGLSEAHLQQEQQMQEIKRHQQKITVMLHKLVDQVTASQDKIINDLK